MSPSQTLLYSNLFAQLQCTQDQLAEQTGICLVLVDEHANEITLPSGLPIMCARHEHPRYRCRQHHIELINQIPANQDYVVDRCPQGLYEAALRTSVRYEDGPVYLLLGRTRERELIDQHIHLLRAVFVLPFETPVLRKQRESDSDWEPPQQWPALTPQESRVLACIVEGMSNKEIARYLRISYSTVKTHVANILRKLNVSNRTEATVLALKRGFGHDDPFD